MHSIDRNNAGMNYRGVQTFAIIQRKLGWTDYKMSKSLGISQTSYIYLKNKSKSTQTKLLKKLAAIAEANLGMTGGEFWELFKKEPG